MVQNLYPENAKGLIPCHRYKGFCWVNLGSQGSGGHNAVPSFIGLWETEKERVEKK